ncbi:MAG: LysR family transcriptional regulator [Pseudomonas sp.]|nr:LysR family transcriptional regulator [Pseudomonas sp.]
MNLKQLEFAIAVAEEGNFTRAAERCNVVQSALSHQIARLEEELGTRLFERRPRQVLVTAAGEALLEQARLAVEATRRIPAAVAAVAGEVRGSLTVGMISSLDLFDIVQLLAAFHTRFAQIDIALRQEHSEILLEAVRKRSIDLAFIGVPASTLLEGVEKRLLAEEELVAVLPPGHSLAGRERLHLEEIQYLPLVDFPAGSSARQQTDEAFAALGLPHRVRFEISHIDLMARFVRGGMAVGLAPTSTAATFDGLTRIPVCDAPKRRVFAIWPSTPTPATRELLSELETLLARTGLTAAPSIP